MKNLAISRRYARAMIIIGKEDNKAEQYKDELGQVVDFFDKNENFELTLINPLFNKNDRRNTLKAVLAKTELSNVVKSFIILLFEKGRIKFLREIISYYQELYDEFKGVVKASIISATELSSDSIEKIKEALSKRIGKDIVLEVKQDSSLIGGIITKIGDLILDGSIKTQFANMRETLKRGNSV